MKKFILSATLALAYFAAQAKNEVIKNDDDKNPKNKAKVVAKAKTAPLGNCSGNATIECTNGSTWTGVITWQSDDCKASAKRVLQLAGELICG